MLQEMNERQLSHDSYVDYISVISAFDLEMCLSLNPLMIIIVYQVQMGVFESFVSYCKYRAFG